MTSNGSCTPLGLLRQLDARGHDVDDDAGGVDGGDRDEKTVKLDAGGNRAGLEPKIPTVSLQKFPPPQKFSPLEGFRRVQLLGL